MTDLKAEKYKKMLQEIGGWDNSLVSVNSGAVRSIIEDLERLEADKERLEGELTKAKDDVIHYSVQATDFANMAEAEFKHSAQLAQDKERLEARVDALMWEYCPEDMTPGQIVNYAKHQRPVSPEVEAEIEQALKDEHPVDCGCPHCRVIV